MVDKNKPWFKLYDKGVPYSVIYPPLSIKQMFNSCAEKNPDRDYLINTVLGTNYGDADLDKVFDSQDLIQVLQVGKYELRVSATWSEGDWNGDALFNTSDLVLAAQAGAYVESRGVRVAATGVRSGDSEIDAAVAALDADRVLAQLDSHDEDEAAIAEVPVTEAQDDLVARPIAGWDAVMAEDDELSTEHVAAAAIATEIVDEALLAVLAE